MQLKGKNKRKKKKPATRCSFEWDSQKRDEFRLQSCLDTPLFKAFKS